jgi:hypothetical protein
MAERITEPQLADALKGLVVTVEDGEEGTEGKLRHPGGIARDVFYLVFRSGEAEQAAPQPQHSPGYYDGKTGMQPFDVIDEFGLDFYEGNVVKYLVRWRKKNGLEDLRKARTYLSRIIARAEAETVTSG